MKKIMILFVFLMTTSALMSQVTIKGTVIGADSKPIENGFAAFIDEEYIVYQKSKTNSDGKFEIEYALKEQSVSLIICAPYHTPVRMTLPIYEDKVIELDVKLQSLILLEQGVGIITEIENYDFRKSKPMLKNQDGTYSFETTHTKNSLRYQIYYKDEFNGRILPFPSHGTVGEISFNEYGGFESTIPVVDGKATIIFDPSKLLKTSNDSYARILNETLNIKKELQKEFEKVSFSYSKSRFQFMEKNNNLDSFTFDVSEWNDFLNSYYKSSNASTMQTTLDIYYIKSYGFYKNDPKLRDNYNETIAKNFLKNTPYNSKLWLFMREQIYMDVLEIVYKNDLESKFKEVLKICKEDIEIDTKSSIYLSLLYETKSKGSPIHKKVYDQAMIESNGTFYSMMFEDLYNPDKKIEVGKSVPQFEIESIDDSKKVISNNSLLGKYYLIDFWATWCKPCMEEMSSLHIAFEKFKDVKGFTIISLSLDKDLNKVIEHRKNSNFSMPWNHGYIKDGIKSAISKQFEVKSIPRVILVDDKGKIVALDNNLRGSNLEEILTKYLK